MSQCAIEQCELPTKARGFCRRHYERWRKHGDPRVVRKNQHSVVIEELDWTNTKPGAWVARAVCSSVDPELFFPNRGESPVEAKAVCRSCPVRRECLEFALETNQTYGIWGGTSDQERRRIKRNVRQVA